MEQNPTTAIIQQRTAYKGIFTNVEGTKRGTIQMNVDETDMATAILTLQNGETIELRSDAPLFTENTNVHFHSTGAQDASWNFSSEADGSNPTVTDVRMENEDASVLMAIESAAAPVSPITGTYSCDNCSSIGVGFPNTNLTWNMMSIGEGDSEEFMISSLFIIIFLLFLIQLNFQTFRILWSRKTATNIIKTGIIAGVFSEYSQKHQIG